jgi:hypothetical protein
MLKMFENFIWAAKIALIIGYSYFLLKIFNEDEKNH